MAGDDQSLFEQIMGLPSMQAGLWLVICAALFTTLQHLFAHDRSQPVVRPDAWIDAFYWLVGPAIYAGISVTILIGGLNLIHGGDMDAVAAWLETGAPWAASIPLVMQCLLILIVTDIYMYWCHRLFHGGRLWRYHAIHHSAEDMDWLHSVRFHPVNLIPHALVSGALAWWIGFAPAAIAMLVPFNILYSAMVHANLNWTFGPFRYVLASPVFHRWHHTGPDEGGSKNFAPTFPVLDLMFGTFYMPEGKLPGKTGLVEADMPASLSGQLLYPWLGGTSEAKHGPAEAPQPAPR
jgi:sterol desaturase/sphingolipid hydroxylase (fatty acid hydroxylase superfamily)